MKMEWMNHTGFVVSDMERSLGFYRDLLGLKVETDGVREGEEISRVVGYPDAKIRAVYLGAGDMRHSIELIEYINPVGKKISPVERNDVGATHLGIIVDDLESIYQDLSAKGVEFVGPPVVRPDRTLYARKVAYLQDPDGNWLEFLEGSPELRYY